jgi:transposase
MTRRYGRDRGKRRAYDRSPLRKGDIVIMDNLSSHKGEEITAVIAGAGARILYVPPYSPDLNPIEEMRSKIKANLRKAKARTEETLLAAIREVFKRVTAEDCAGWFAHAGYPVDS